MWSKVIYWYLWIHFADWKQQTWDQLLITVIYWHLRQPSYTCGDLLGAIKRCRYVLESADTNVYKRLCIYVLWLWSTVTSGDISPTESKTHVLGTTGIYCNLMKSTVIYWNLLIHVEIPLGPINSYMDLLCWDFLWSAEVSSCDLLGFTNICATYCESTVWMFLLVNRDLYGGAVGAPSWSPALLIHLIVTVVTAHRLVVPVVVPLAVVVLNSCWNRKMFSINLM